MWKILVLPHANYSPLQNGWYALAKFMNTPWSDTCVANARIVDRVRSCTPYHVAVLIERHWEACTRPETESDCSINHMKSVDSTKSPTCEGPRRLSCDGQVTNCKAQLASHLVNLIEQCHRVLNTRVAPSILALCPTPSKLAHLKRDRWQGCKIWEPTKNPDHTKSVKNCKLLTWYPSSPMNDQDCLAEWFDWRIRLGLPPGVSVRTSTWHQVCCT